VKDCPISSGI